MAPANKKVLGTFIFILLSINLGAQQVLNLKYKKSTIYSGIEVGSKGIKLSILEIGRGAQKASAFNILKDTSINTDFISFTGESFKMTLNGLTDFYNLSLNNYGISADKIFTMFSSGVYIRAVKDEKIKWLSIMADSFRLKINEPLRKMDAIDVLEEARLSHLGIIPDTKRYTTFLIDIGSGNTKGGYFPNGNTKDFKLFELTWGTKSVANETEKRLANDLTLINYNKQLSRVLSSQADDEIIYAVNASGAYNMSDNIAFSGGIAWATATLISPQLLDNSVVPVTFDEVKAFHERISANYNSLTPEGVLKTGNWSGLDKGAIVKEIRKVNAVFDQQALLAGTGLLLNIMRQFEGVYEKKQFFMIKNGQVGWISAYVDQTLNKLQP